MEIAIFELPKTAVGIISLIGLLAMVISSIVYYVRYNDLKLIRESNADLRAANSDKDKEIKEIKDKLDELERKFEALEKRNRSIEELVVTALKQYFIENPIIAKGLKDGGDL